MRYLITFSYDGSKYSGYQKQPNKRTIQGEIEKALFKINSEKKVSVSASGRTDSGVHALNQKAHFDLNSHIETSRLQTSLNSLLPDDIYIKDVKEVNDDFHARYDVVRKEYIYRINMGEYNPIEKDYCMQYNKQLDISEMQRALKYLEGTHDFKTFTKTDEEKDFTRTILQANIIRDLKNVNEITISLVGSGFLRYMVRNIVGTLIEVGEGKRKSEDMITLLKAKDRKKAGKTAIPNGLYLKDVWY